MRELSPDDLALWQHVTRNINPYHGARSVRHAAPEQPPETPPAPPSEPRRTAPPKPPQPLTVGAAADMDRRTAKRLKRGELPIDGRLDLHGLTLDQAHAAVGGFLRKAQGHGARCVVVITGKGERPYHRDQESSSGKIRREMPHWLNQPALRPLVLAITEARNRDGGTGAFYVLLRRRR